jgi:hypothetical protein
VVGEGEAAHGEGHQPGGEHVLAALGKHLGRGGGGPGHRHDGGGQAVAEQLPGGDDAGHQAGRQGEPFQAVGLKKVVVRSPKLSEHAWSVEIERAVHAVERNEGH